MKQSQLFALRICSSLPAAADFKDFAFRQVMFGCSFQQPWPKEYKPKIPVILGESPSSSPRRAAPDAQLPEHPRTKPASRRRSEAEWLLESQLEVQLCPTDGMEVQSLPGGPKARGRLCAGFCPC